MRRHQVATYRIISSIKSQKIMIKFKKWRTTFLMVWKLSMTLIWSLLALISNMTVKFVRRSTWLYWKTRKAKKTNNPLTVLKNKFRRIQTNIRSLKRVKKCKVKLIELLKTPKNLLVSKKLRSLRYNLLEVKMTNF